MTPIINKMVIAFCWKRNDFSVLLFNPRLRTWIVFQNEIFSLTLDQETLQPEWEGVRVHGYLPDNVLLTGSRAAGWCVNVSSWAEMIFTELIRLSLQDNEHVYPYFHQITLQFTKQTHATTHMDIHLGHGMNWNWLVALFLFSCYFIHALALVLQLLKGQLGAIV